MPCLPEAGVVGLGQFCQHGVGMGLKPFDEMFEVLELHGRATGGAIVVPAPNMKEDFVTRLGNGIGVIVLDQHEPLIGGIAKMHIFLRPPIGERSSRRQGVEMVIGKLRQLGIVDPGITISDLMIRPALGAFGQGRRVAHREADFEQTFRIAMIARLFLRSRLRRIEASPPRKTSPSEKYRPRFSLCLPIAGSVPAIKLQGPLKGRRIVSKADDHLLGPKAKVIIRSSFDRNGSQEDEPENNKKECHEAVHLR